MGAHTATHVLRATLVCALAGACSNDRGDLFAPPDAARPGPVGSSPSPYEQALQFAGQQPSCVDCMREACDAPAHECADDSACAAEVECRRPCRDPGCYVECGFEYALGQRPSSALEKCSVSECLEPCEIGRDFGCVGDWQMPSPEVVVTVLKLQLGDLTPGPLLEDGLRARACPVPTDPACQDGGSPTLTNADGQVEVRLPNRGGDNKGYTPFAGFIALDDPVGEPSRITPTMLFPQLGWSASYEHFVDALVFTPTISAFGTVTYFTGEPAPESVLGTGSLGGVVLDCRSSNEVRSVGLTVELSGAPGATVASPSLAGTSGFFSAVNVPSGNVAVTVRDGMRIVAERSVPVVADEATYLWLLPLTASD